jgi:hypothetical protein
VIELISKSIFFDVGVYSKSSVPLNSQKLSVILAFPKRIDLISVPAKTIPAVNFRLFHNRIWPFIEYLTDFTILLQM